jgi:hypothetical protein
MVAGRAYRNLMTVRESLVGSDVKKKLPCTTSRLVMGLATNSTDPGGR